MVKLYQLEGGAACATVRRFLAKTGISFETVNVPKLRSERGELLARKDLPTAEVPVLLDGETIVQGSEAIIAHLRAQLPDDNGFGDPAYGLTRTLAGVGYADAIVAVKDALAGEGFGVLTEIDVKATLKKKIGADFRNYVILGACNPKLAHEALSAELAIGLLLPCNVVVTEDLEGNAVVSAIDPSAMFRVAERADIEPLAAEVGEKLRRVLAAL